MPTYQFERNGEVIERQFAYGTVPDEIDGFKRVLSYPMSITLVGGIDGGWTKPQIGDTKFKYATWTDVDHAMNTLVPDYGY
jgi:hypothetical protein